MIAYATYCSADKREDPGDLPALERYLDPRIHDLAAKADANGARFLILSGEYGLLRPDDPIPWYDHLLMPDEAEDMAQVVGLQLHMYGVREVVWFTADPGRDRKVAAYLKAMGLGCARQGIPLRVEILDGGGDAC